MLRINDNTRIYINCPAGVVTGGTELLHQLEDYLVSHGIESYMVYFGEEEHCVPEAFKKYKIKVTENIEDNENNVEVYCEINFDNMKLHPKIQKLIWWMSVDNYLIHNNSSLKDLFQWDLKRGLKIFLKRIRNSVRSKTIFKWGRDVSSYPEDEYMHCYQSEYAKQFLADKGIHKSLPLSDYINQEFMDVPFVHGRKNIVLYNPSKGFKFTRKLMESAPDIQWFALKGLNRTQLIEIMRTAQVYIDFGGHPGKDRLPRECAMNGCVIITGKRGAAKYKEDVWIDDTYKFNENQITQIIAKIRQIFEDYDSSYSEQSEYHARIRKEKEIFEKEIDDLFLSKK